jgi:signal peptidase II
MQSDNSEAGHRTSDIADAPMSDVRSPMSNGRLFWPILLAVVATDVTTKTIAVRKLGGPLEKVPHEIFGEWFRFTLVYNPGAAFGLNVGDYSRWVFMALTIGALLILGRLYVTTRAGDSMRIASLALVCGGALGNLLDRIRSAKGVVDFLDIGVGSSRWPTFNVADMAVSIGAFLLAIVLWQEDRPTEESSRIGMVSSELRHESGEAT